MNLQKELMKIGFTEYEAKVYLAMLRDNPATGYQLSKESGVPRSMVYEALKRLHDKGAALETVEGRTTLYQPLPPNILLERQEKEHRRLLRRLRQGLSELYNVLEDDRVWSISGRSTTLAYTIRMLQQAEMELFLVLSDDDLEALRDEIMAANNRGVRVNTLLTGEGLLDCGQVAYHPPLESQLQGLTNTLLVVVDGAEVLIASVSARKETTATITRNDDLVLIARQFVWMELFTQRIYVRLGADLLARLDTEDRQIFESLSHKVSSGG